MKYKNFTKTIEKYDMGIKDFSQFSKIPYNTIAGWSRKGAVPDYVEVILELLEKKNQPTKILTRNMIKKRIAQATIAHFKRKDLYLFAYGSLKKNFHNEDYLIGATFEGKSRTVDKYTLIKTNHDPFPFLLPEPSSNIKGELYKIDSNILKKLDKLEGCPRFYTRKKIKINTTDNRTVEAIAYFLKNKSVLNKKVSIKIAEWRDDDEYEIISENLYKTLKKVIGEK